MFMSITKSLVRYLSETVFLLAFLCVSVSLWLIFPFKVKAQARPVYDYGAIGLGQLLKRLNNTKSVMHIGAHRDDEDSGLLAYLARGENARPAYLSLTRGDGGQNIIGPELFESLGVIRTEELLQARRLDGAEQYFTRAFDYGFSKTLAEAKQRWDEKVILCDAVRAIRTFRPLVVISRFSGTPADGHGQHQFAGYIAPLAVKAAADANQCQDAGAPWQVLKFYVSQGFRSSAQPTLRLNTGQYDFLLGRSYFEIAMEGRSQHKTQEQGVLELKGERFSGLNLIESKAARAERETGVFDGIDTSLINTINLLSRNEKAVTEYTREKLATAQKSAERAAREFDPNNPQEIVPVLIEGRKSLSDLFASYTVFSGPPERQEKFREKLQNESDISGLTFKKLLEFDRALKLALGIRIETLANQETVAPREDFLTAVKVFYPENASVKFKGIEIKAPQNWQVSPVEEPKNDSPAASFFRENAKESKFFNVKIPGDAQYTQPYFLGSPRDGYLYVWKDPINQNLPFQYSLINGYAAFEINGETITFNQPVEFRFADDIRGEVRRNLNVVPKISLQLNQDLVIVPQSGGGKAQTRKIALSITNNSAAEMNGAAKLNVPRGWRIAPAAANFNLKNKGAKTSVEFTVTIPANVKIGEFDISAEAATANGEIFTKTMNTIAYPHIQTHRFYADAKTKVSVLDLKTAPPVRVGYITGSGDAVPEAIRQLGLSVELLDENALTSGDLTKYDVIVAGIRASQVRLDFTANHGRLLDYVRAGGTLIVQYQRPDYESLLPFPAKMTARVTDENAPVTILDLAHPVFNFPNKISGEDFKNWVQERNLYSFSTFDANYKPLLEAHDAGEAENKGGLMAAEIGKGKFVYTSYAFFRQLPAGVPGAYRIFANLLSLPKSGGRRQ